MKITVNGEAKTVAASAVTDVLVELGYGNAKVATAINGEFLPASLRSATKLDENDQLEIVAPRQGG